MHRVRELARHGPAVAATAAVASHATGLGGGYIWLDHAHLEDGLALASFGDWPSLFTHGFAGTGFYRPIVALSLSADALVSDTPGFFKAVTLGWHAAASSALVIAARALGASAKAALLAGLLFAVHPATSLVASANAFRSEAMLTVFLLGLVVAHLQQKPIPAALFLAGGALTKETAWVLGPLFVVALEIGRTAGARVGPGAGTGKRTGRSADRRLLFPEATALVVTTVMRLAWAPHFRAMAPALSIGEAVGSRLGALAKGAMLVLVPWDIPVCDAFAVSGVTSLGAMVGMLVLAGVGVLALRRGPLAWLFGLALLPSLQIVPVMRWWSPHYFYTAFAFGSMLFADAVDRRIPARFGLVAAAAMPLAVLSLRDGGRYSSDLKLWEPEVRAEPACREGHFFLGEVARERKDWVAAAIHYEHAASPVPGYLTYADEGAAFQNLGAVRMAQERWGEARAAFASALERAPEPDQRRRIVHNLAVAALGSGDPAEAVRLLETEMREGRPLRESLLVRAKALHELGREDEARAIIEGLMSSKENP